MPALTMCLLMQIQFRHEMLQNGTLHINILTLNHKIRKSTLPLVNPNHNPSLELDFK